MYYTLNEKMIEAGERICECCKMFHPDYDFVMNTEWEMICPDCGDEQRCQNCGEVNPETEFVEGTRLCPECKICFNFNL